VRLAADSASGSDKKRGEHACRVRFGVGRYGLNPCPGDAVKCRGLETARGCVYLG
jgi:hypothetical protein